MAYDKILPFLTDLARNNDRTWFADNRMRYEEVRAEMLDLTAVLIREIAVFDPEIRHLEPKECLFRIYRDTRFSPNKMPYKLHFGTYIASGGGSRSRRSGYYVHLQPGACMVSGGIWCTDTKQMRHFRSVIDTEYEELREIMAEPEFVRLFGGRMVSMEAPLQRPPQGYKADHPAIEWLKMKQWCVEHDFADEMVDSDGFVQHVVEAARVMMPFSKWCNRAMFE